MYEIKRLMQYIAKVYALIFMNSLFILSVCLTLTLAEKALKYKQFMNIIINLGLAVLPLLIWSVIYYIFFHNKMKSFIYNSSSQQMIAWFGYLSFIGTISSILKEAYQASIGKVNFIPAGIVGQYLQIILQLNHGHFPSLSPWLVLRYILIFVFLCSYILSFIHYLQINLPKQKNKIKTEKETTETPAATTAKAKTNKNKKKVHRKKLNYIK